jgi:hypothetical protein
MEYEYYYNNKLGKGEIIGGQPNPLVAKCKIPKGAVISPPVFEEEISIAKNPILISSDQENGELISEYNIRANLMSNNHSYSDAKKILNITMLNVTY